MHSCWELLPAKEQCLSVTVLSTSGSASPQFQRAAAAQRGWWRMFSEAIEMFNVIQHGLLSSGVCNLSFSDTIPPPSSSPPLALWLRAVLTFTCRHAIAKTGFCSNYCNWSRKVICDVIFKPHMVKIGNKIIKKNVLDLIDVQHWELLN